METSKVKATTWIHFGFLLMLFVLQIIIILLITGVIKSNYLPAKDFPKPKTQVQSEKYGTMADGTEIFKYTLRNSKGTRLEVITLGGIMTELWVPDKYGNFKDVLLFYKDLATLEKRMVDTQAYPYFGALVGRVAGRVSGAQFTLNGTTYRLADNNDGSTLHGGSEGWSLKVWNAAIEEENLRLSLTSPDGDNGFPGRVEVSATYSLSDDDALTIEWNAQTHGSDTPINPTSHGYFNLAGEGSGTILGQNVEIYADAYIASDSKFIPYGNITSVTQTGFDLRRKQSWGRAISNVISSSELNDMVVCFKLQGPEGLRYAARVEDPVSGRVMKVYTDQVGLQIYASDYVNVPAEEGKNGHAYPEYSGFCMETQNFPDAINNPMFPDSLLRQGSEYKQIVVYKFSTL